MATIQRGLIQRGDIALWDGVTKTQSRVDATGGTVTGLTVGDFVDVLQVYGEGTERTRATVATAISRIGSSNVTLLFATGTWDIPTSLTVPSNFSCVIPAGCVFSVASGQALTFSGPVFTESETFASGAGDVVILGNSLGNIGRVAGEIAAGVTPVDYQYPPGDVFRYGATLDGVTDDTAALADWWAVGKQGVPIFGRAGTAITSTPLATTTQMDTTGNGMRIKLTAAAAHVVSFDYSGAGEAWDYGGKFTGFVLDGDGHATYGLAVTAVINGDFSGNQVTNVTTTGVYARFAQLCNFDDTIVSNNYEAFTTTPVNGIHFDEGPGTITSSSANSIEKCTIEHVSGVGIWGQWLINSIIWGGTSEGNLKGIVIGHATSGSGIANVIGGGIDLEANTTTDIELLATAYGNFIDGIAGGFESPAILVSGSNNNHFSGGTCGGITFDATANHNTVYGTTIVGTGRTITDAGTGNSWYGCFNITDGTVIGDNQVRRRANFSLGGGGTATINHAITSYAVITAGGATLTVAAPTNPIDGESLDITIHNTSGGGITTTWNGIFKMSAWSEPATGNNRSIRFRYDSNYGFWYQIGPLNSADVAN